MIVQTTTTLSESLLQVIEQEMALRRLNVSQLAAMAGVSRVNLSRVLSRKRDPTVSWLGSVISALSLDVVVVRTSTTGLQCAHRHIGTAKKTT